MPPISLSICIIGRNVAWNLGRLGDSIEPLHSKVVNLEVVYVDSASEDDGPEVAARFADVIAYLPADPRLCPSLGRFWASQLARGQWVLYLDGDMVLHADFLDVIATWIAREDSRGLVGQYIDSYPDGSRRHNALGVRLREGVTSHFGGAVLLKRQAVLAAGNWDPGLYAYEEIELYSRLRAAGHLVEYRHVPMVIHYTPRVGKLRRLCDNIVPGTQRLGKRYWGFGQLIASLRGGGYTRFLLCYPYPFVYWLSLASATILSVIGLPGVAALVFAGGTCYVWVTKGLRFVALYSVLPLQVLAGIGRYDRGPPVEPIRVGTTSPLVGTR